MTSTRFYILGLIALLAGLLFFSESPERILGTPDALKSDGDSVPFAVARNTKTKLYDKEGQLSYTFNAQRLEHYRETMDGKDKEKEKSADFYTLIDKPELVFLQGNEPWLVTANKGKLSSLNQMIELWSEVLVVHTNQDAVKTTIETELLLIDPVGKLAKTEETVKISSEKVEINGTGMNADFVAQKLKLLSGVHGFYDPN